MTSNTDQKVFQGSSMLVHPKVAAGKRSALPSFFQIWLGFTGRPRLQPDYCARTGEMRNRLLKNDATYVTTGSYWTSKQAVVRFAITSRKAL